MPDLEQFEDPVDFCIALEQELRQRSDAEILNDLQSLAPLPHEDDPRWRGHWRTEPLWLQGYIYCGLAGAVYTRQLKAALPLLLERVCCGDPGEMFRMMPECLCGTAPKDWQFVFDLCMRASKWPHPGTRLWVMETLKVYGYFPTEVYGQRRAAVLEGLKDKEARVREAAESALWHFDQDDFPEKPETFSSKMAIRGRIIATEGSLPIDLERWCELCEQHPNLAEMDSTLLPDPLKLGQMMEIAAPRGSVDVIVAERECGTMEWTADAPPGINVRGEFDVMIPIAQRIAESLCAAFIEDAQPVAVDVQVASNETFTQANQISERET